MKVEIGACPNYAGIMAAGCQELVRLSVESTVVPRPADDSQRNSGLPVDTTIVTSPSRAATASAPKPGGDSAPTRPEFETSWLDALPAGGGRLNGYDIEATIGRGGMGVVLRAYDPALDRRVAIKMLRPEGMIMTEGRARFQQEARAVAAVQHENVVAIYAVSEVHGMPYLVMEFVAGMSLQDRIDREGRLPLADLIRYGRQIASGLHAAHRRRIIHRDIKPANILIAAESASAKITDFGLARVEDQARLSRAGALIGTPQYMAPEQFGADNIDHRADLFSLGSLLYTSCAGKPPFLGETVLSLMNQITNKTPAPLRSLRPDVPVWLADLISKLHAKAPALRYQSAADVVRRPSSRTPDPLAFVPRKPTLPRSDRVVGNGVFQLRSRNAFDYEATMPGPDPFAAKRAAMLDEFYAKFFLLGGWLGATDTYKRTMWAAVPDIALTRAGYALTMRKGLPEAGSRQPAHHGGA